MRLLLYITVFITALMLFPSCSHHSHLQKTDVTANKPGKRNEPAKTTEKLSSSVKEKYAAVLGVDPKQIKNEKLYDFINDWYGVPYKYAGKDKTGIDCSGFALILYNSVYQKKLSPSAKAQAEETKKIDPSSLQEGDLVFFDIDSGRISHVGVYLQNNKFVHASTKKGVIINDLNEPYYKKYFVRSGRLK